MGGDSAGGVVKVELIELRSGRWWAVCDCEWQVTSPTEARADARIDRHLRVEHGSGRQAMTVRYRPDPAGSAS